MFNSVTNQDIRKAFDAYARYEKKKAKLPEGEDVIKHLSSKDRVAIDRLMHSCLGYGLHGTVPIHPLDR